jgi:16S rRNA (guanine966-N2)-methyltransferase
MATMAGRKQKGGPQAGRLRIVAGNWRSRLLDIADVEGLRPTSERVRETLFNWLSPVIQGAKCLDLYAGTGALGLEALSRGAASVVFVERSSVAARQLRRNIELLDARGATVLQQDALAYLRGDITQRFDVVFLDPPFAADLLDETCRLLQERGCLAGDAFVYLEQAAKARSPELPAGWQLVKDKKAGQVRYMLARAGVEQ